MKWYLLNIDHKMIYKGKQNWNHNCLLIIFYQIFQEIELFNRNPFDSLWERKLQISNNCIVVELCEYKETDYQVIWNCNYPKFSYVCDLLYLLRGQVRQFSFMIISYMFIT